MPLTDADERRLHSAFDAACASIEAGDSPNDAVYKAAKAHDLGPGGIDLLCRTLNVGKQSDLREGSDEPEAIFSKFALADADAVKERLGSEVKTASDEDYMPPIGYRRPEPVVRFQLARPVVKTAAVVEAPVVPAVDPVPHVFRLKAAWRAAEKETAASCGRYKHKKQQVADAVKKVAEILTDANVREYRYTVGDRFGKEASDKLFDLLAPNAPKGMPTSTRAVDWARDDYRRFEACLDAVKEAADAKDEWDAAAKKEAEAKEAYEIGRVDDGRSIGELLDEDDGSCELGLALHSVKRGGMGDFLGSLAGNYAAMQPVVSAMKQQPKNELLLERLEQLSDPDHDANLRKVRAQSIIGRLMSDPDDPISGYDPQLVLSKYNEISDMAPRVADKPALLRPMLNRALAGNAQIYEGKALLDTEQSLRDMDRMVAPSGMLPPPASAPVPVKAPSKGAA